MAYFYYLINCINCVKHQIMIGWITKSIPFKIWNTPSCRYLLVSPNLCMEPGSSKNVDNTKGGKKHPLVLECLMKTVKPPLGFDPSWPQPKIVIVGSGMAGLSAAERLLERGIQNFIILEALGRPGGRIHTCQLNKATIDFGSDKILGANLSNPSFSLAMSEKVLLNPRKEKLTGPYYMTDGTIIYEVDKPYKILEKAFTKAAGLFMGDKKVNKSLRSYIDPFLKKDVSTLQDPEKSEYFFVMNGMMNEIRLIWGDDLANISADYFGSYVRIPAGNVILKNGKKTLIDPILKKVKDKIRYNKPVQNIRWDRRPCPETNRGSVLCCDGEEIPCDYIICTVSLGVLKAQVETFFSPELPEAKRDAIRNIGYGHVNYIFMEYERPFWGPGEGEIKVGWNSLQLQSRDTWLKGIGAIQEVAPRVLRIGVGGREAALIESCTNGSLAEDATNFLRTIIGDPSIPCPVNIARSRWSSDLYFMGARSFLGLSSSVNDQCALACPLPAACDPPPIVLFAGEATIPGFYSTVHGARLSGIREADRILQLSKVYKGPPCVHPCGV